MRKLNVYTEKAQILDLRGDFNRYSQYDRIMKTFGGAISANRSIFGFESYMERILEYTGSDYKTACFSELVVASASSLFQRFDENQGDEVLLWEYRNLVLAKMGLDPNGRASKHRILIIKKQKSMLRPISAGFTRTHFHDIYNVNEVVDHLRTIFPRIEVEIVSPGESIKEEIQCLQTATIVISPNGGISTMLAFLPRGSHAIIMDYYVDKPENGYLFHFSLKDMHLVKQELWK
jgi:hypothetical protein